MDRSWQRWSAISGVLFAVLLVVGNLIGRLPGGSNSDHDFANFVNDHSHRARIYVSAALIALSAVALLHFLSGLRERLLASEGAPGRLTALAFGAGVATASLLGVTAAAEAAQASPISFGKEHAVGATIAYVGWLGVWTFIFGMLMAAALTLAVSLLVFRTGVFANWIGWLGVVTVIALLFAFVFLPAIMVVVWTLAVSITMLRRPESPAVRANRRA
jgi:MFS family permease